MTPISSAPGDLPPSRLMTRIVGIRAIGQEALANAEVEPEVLPPDSEPPAAAMAPVSMPTIELCNHHASGGYLAQFCGVRGLGPTKLEAIAQLVLNGGFGSIHIADHT